MHFLNSIEKKFRAFIFMVGAGILLGAPCALGAPHVADFNLGMPKEQVAQRVQNACGQDLCGEVNFGEATWNGIFKLDEGTTLGAMSLRGALSNHFMDAAFKGIEQSPYVLVYAETASLSFSFLALAKEGKTKAEMEAEFKKFVQSVHESGNSYATYVYMLPEMFEEMKKKDTAELPRAFPGNGVCTLHIAAEGVTVLIGTASYLADHMPAALPIIKHGAVGKNKAKPNAAGKTEEPAPELN